MRAIDLTGRKLGMLRVERRHGTVLVGTQERFAWHCKCDCGSERVVSSQALLRSRELCCGCTYRSQGQPITLDWLFNRCQPIPYCGCWVWMGAISAGYGHVRDKGKLFTAHFLSFTLSGGIIPIGHELDHLCRVRSCINPDHLEPVTHVVNVLRGARSALRTIKTICPQGHPYEGENRYDYDGKVFCRACNRAFGAIYRQKLRSIKQESVV